MKLLICVSYYHYVDGRTYTLVHNTIANIIKNYDCILKIVVHTNSEQGKQAIISNFQDVLVIVCSQLQHPFSLTLQHRQYMHDNIDAYDTFMYIEDDMIVSYQALCNYLNNFNVLWPHYVPSFLRFEMRGEELYTTDITTRHSMHGNVMTIAGKDYYNFNKLYCGCWAITKDILKQLLDVLISPIPLHPLPRETAASFVNRQLQKPCLVEVHYVDTKLHVNNLSLIYHSSNIYVNNIKEPWAKLNVKDIFIK